MEHAPTRTFWQMSHFFPDICSSKHRSAKQSKHKVAATPSPPLPCKRLRRLHDEHRHHHHPTPTHVW